MSISIFYLMTVIYNIFKKYGIYIYIYIYILTLFEDNVCIALSLDTRWIDR